MAVHTVEVFQRDQPRMKEVLAIADKALLVVDLRVEDQELKRQPAPRG